jgi:hypothetical protein
MVLLTQFRPRKSRANHPFPRVACLKMLKTFTNLPFLTFTPGSMAESPPDVFLT